MAANHLPEFNEHILKNMIESLGIDRQKTLEVCYLSKKIFVFVCL